MPSQTILTAALLPLLGLTDGISTCGSQWMSTSDVTIARGTDNRTGFQTAAKTFCAAADSQVVNPNNYLSMATEVFLSGGRDPTTYGVVGFVYFEIHNKQKSDHKVSKQSCEQYLLALSADGGKCSGSNRDTKGGTWQIGNDGVSYHALANEVPPRQDGLNRIFRGQVLEVQTVGKGAEPPLDPWPFDSLKSVQPTTCHSHNDYDGNIPLFSALSVGCTSVEADVFYSGGDVIIAHSSPTAGRTLSAQYVRPLQAILNYNNRGSSGSNGVFQSRPQQSLVLVVDLKTSESATLDAVVRAVQPLRDGGHLSSIVSGKFVERQITVVAIGSAPFDRISSGDGIPNKDIFYDAKLGGLAAETSNLNSYYASTDFQAAIGRPGSVEAFTQAQRDKVASQVKSAHAVGLKTRYWNLPGDYLWEPLATLGVDVQNADDMYDTARLPRI